VGVDNAYRHGRLTGPISGTARATNRFGHSKIGGWPANHSQSRNLSEFVKHFAPAGVY
jgi:hypothetical protein